MKFVFFRFQRTEKIDLVTKRLMGAMPPPQNFWDRTAPACKPILTSTKNFIKIRL